MPGENTCASIRATILSILPSQPSQSQAYLRAHIMCMKASASSEKHARASTPQQSPTQAHRHHLSTPHSHAPSGKHAETTLGHRSWEADRMRVRVVGENILLAAREKRVRLFGIERGK